MSRLPESVAALALSIGLCATATAGPALAEPTSTASTTTAVPTTTEPTTPQPTTPQPTTTEPTSAVPTTDTQVPGGIAPRVVGYLGRPKDKPLSGWPRSDAVPGVEVFLRDQATGAVVARAVTEANGTFTFRDVPAGTYEFGVGGPWRLLSAPVLVVRAGEDGPVPMPHFVYVEPVPAPPGAGGGAAPREELAATGAGVGLLALLGVLALVAGGVLVRRVRT
ncbi:carboxypeptidase-like regulatory domain-containing protein [Saccharothrix variisporea]|uniref:Carboxypeptidase family protein n=1 Tax=Saccharothrix variisporea TaxID=543527 RepID=A0A495X2Q4_9PSEU|nr:carboxypeptidase-like regulatory domain-containing protein [Saccharothrix variisporea]RKT67819.1 carboxypeptidase family protein [Saccharothrix variisporea]